MQATVNVYVKASEKFILEVKSPKYVNINGVLNTKESNPNMMYGTDSTNWRDLKLPPQNEVRAKEVSKITNSQLKISKNQY